MASDLLDRFAFMFDGLKDISPVSLGHDRYKDRPQVSREEVDSISDAALMELLADMFRRNGDDPTVLGPLPERKPKRRIPVGNPIETYHDAIAHGWQPPPGAKRPRALVVPPAPADPTRMTVPEYPDYEIDQNGRVWSKERYTRGGAVGRYLPGRFLRPFMMGHRGPYYSLCNEDGKRSIPMARLLAVTWGKT